MLGLLGKKEKTEYIFKNLKKISKGLLQQEDAQYQLEDRLKLRKVEFKTIFNIPIIYPKFG